MQKKCNNNLSSAIPIYIDKSSQVQENIAILLGQVTHHIHPLIVQYIIKKNKKYKPAIDNNNKNIFLYNNSDCVFPGYRRAVNHEKIKQWKRRLWSDYTILDDNTMPRYIWTYLASSKGYTSTSWKDSKLNLFELAHVFGHKVDEVKLEKSIFPEFNDKKPYALFTSASNTVLIPKGLAKPTDDMEEIKLCFYKRHMDLYRDNILECSEFDNTLIPAWYEKFNAVQVPEYYNDIRWNDPILPEGWKAEIDKLLNYRDKHLDTPKKKIDISINPL